LIPEVIKWLNLSTVLASAPFLEFLADRAFKRVFGQISNEIVVKRLGSDAREAVKEVVNKEAVWASLETYADFGDKTSDILQTGIIALLSLLLSQIETTGSVLCTTVPHSLLAAALICYLIFFLVKLSQNKIDPGKVGSTKYYYRVALLFCILAIVVSHVPKNYLLLQMSPSRVQQASSPAH
jgi:hypothetical protein